MQLAVMLQSKVALSLALQILIKQTQKKPIRDLLTSLWNDIQKGSSFAQALAKHPDVFDTLFIITSEVGQETGKLAQSLTSLAVYLEKTNGMKRKFFQAMMYPCLVLTVAFCAVLFLLLFLVPSFADMFRSFQIELSPMTSMTLAASNFVSHYGIYIILLLGTLFFSTRQMLRSARTRDFMDRTIRKIPVFGEIVVRNAVARFCRTLGTLLQAQVSLLDALKLTKRIFPQTDIRNEIEFIIRKVHQGHSIADQIVDSKFFPPMVTKMITVGEETGELDTMLIRLAEQYEKDIESRVETLGSIIEPVIVVFLGFFVALILISMYLPMFDLVNVLSGY
jgi:type IV pilus assembly protein PilC